MARVLKSFGLAAVLVMVAGVGFADEASDYLAAAGDEADSLTKCVTEYVEPLLKSSESAETLADEALNACDDKVGALKLALMGPPTNLSADKATSETQVVKDGYRRQLVEFVQVKRKEN